MSSKENYKFIIAKNSNYEKYGIEPEIFTNLIEEFFDAVGKTVQQNDEKNLAGFCTKSFFEKEKVYPDIEDDMYASHHFHYFFTDAQLKKLVRFYEGSYLARTLNERKFCVDLKSRNRNSK